VKKFFVKNVSCPGYVTRPSQITPLKYRLSLAEVYYKISLEAPGERLRITWTSFLE
jgi:hypothetical protein